MKKILLLVLLLIPILSSAQIYKLGPMTVKDSSGTAVWTNRDLKSGKILTDSLDISGPITKDGVSLDSFYVTYDDNGLSKTKALYSIPITLDNDTLDWSLSNVFSISIVAPTDYAFINITPGQIITIVMTGIGANSATFTNPNIFWQSATAPETTGGGAYDIFTFIAISPTLIFGNAVLNFDQ